MPLAPLAGLLNETVVPLTRLFAASRTVTCKRVTNCVLICADCGHNAGGFDEAWPGIADKAQIEPSRCARCGGPLVLRADDSGAVVLERLKVYHKQTEPLVEYYRSRPTFCSIDGAQPPDRVAADLAVAVEVASSEAGAYGGPPR